MKVRFGGRDGRGGVCVGVVLCCVLCVFLVRERRESEGGRDGSERRRGRVVSVLRGGVLWVIFWVRAFWEGEEGEERRREEGVRGGRGERGGSGVLG